MDGADLERSRFGELLDAYYFGTKNWEKQYLFVIVLSEYKTEFTDVTLNG